MRLLYVVRHASPAIQPGRPAREWALSERGIKEAQVLAGRADGWGLEALYSSSEPKARSTALIIGDAIGLPVHVVDAFDELRMPGWIGNADEFNEAVRTILGEGEASVRGAESATAAAARFAAGLQIVREGPFPAAAVTHGRILTAWLASIGALEDPFETWRTLPMPGAACIDVDAVSGRLLEPFA